MRFLGYQFRELRLLIAIAVWGTATSGWAVAPSIPLDIRRNAEARVDYGYNAGITIGMTRDGVRAYYHYGTVSLDAPALPNEHTLYEIGSVTKVFTSTLLAEMVSRGEVELTEPVEELLPENVTVPSRNGTRITLQHLATHSSGLLVNPPEIATADPVNPFADFEVDDLYDFLSDHTLPRRPGTMFEYSNLGMGLLGHALAARLGMPYDKALEQRILAPLGLHDTVIHPTAEQSARRAPGYSGVVPRPPFSMAALNGAGALLSTANDLLTFLEYQLGVRSSDLESVLAETQRARFNSGSAELNLGLGWFVFSSGSIQFTMHDGATMGHTAFVGFDRRTNTGVTVLTNARINRYAGIQDLGTRLLAPAVPLTAIARPATVPDETLKRFHGRYEDTTTGTSFQFGLRQNHLTVAFSEDRGAQFTLYAQTPRRFNLFEAGIEASATFVVRADGAVDSMTWAQSGQSTSYQKVQIQPRLALTINRQSVPPEVHLNVEGDTDTIYVIEASESPGQWNPVANTTIWDDPITEEISTDNPRRLYRARTAE